MHALPIKPRLPIVRTEPEKHAVDHPHHLSPKRAISPAHQHQAGSPPKTPPLEVHRIEPEGEEKGALESHPLPHVDLQRIYSIKQHPVKDILAEDSGSEEVLPSNGE